MPTFIKPGFWNIKRKQLAGELNLDQLVESKIPAPTYKVFTALLTQSGTDSQQNITGGDLTIGVTYRIGDQAGGTWDFTNVGAPNNNVDTYFVATGTTPNSWGNGILNYNAGAPVAIILENTIGNIGFAYEYVGQYSVNSNNLFVDNKTFINVTHFPAIDDMRLRFSFRKSSDPALINLATVNRNNDGSDDILLNTPIEIRVYN